PDDAGSSRAASREDDHRLSHEFSPDQPVDPRFHLGFFRLLPAGDSFGIPSVREHVRRAARAVS
ncbi:MAG TPA: hypothetical protein DCQ98_06145, partial [Planctomycetaceae bacterium]|nr:hypothetical protein [Planctomycetaceae bacterium]